LVRNWKNSSYPQKKGLIQGKAKSNKKKKNLRPAAP